LQEVGCRHHYSLREENFVEVIKEATVGRGADVIFDPVGGDIFDGSRRCVAFEGRILIIGFAGGRIAEAPTNHLLVKNYSVLGMH
jgi:NADPH2:quinone reductase